MNKIDDLITSKFKNLLNEQISKYNTLVSEYNSIQLKHDALNKELGEYFDSLENIKELSHKEVNYYFKLRCENDVINSKLKLMSVKMNDFHIKYARLIQGYMLIYPKEIKFEKVDINRRDGRLVFKAKFVNNIERNS